MGKYLRMLGEKVPFPSEQLVWRTETQLLPQCLWDLPCCIDYRVPQPCGCMDPTQAWYSSSVVIINWRKGWPGNGGGGYSQGFQLFPLLGRETTHCLGSGLGPKLRCRGVHHHWLGQGPSALMFCGGREMTVPCHWHLSALLMWWR